MNADGTLDIAGTQTRMEQFSSYYSYPFNSTTLQFETINIRNSSTSPLMFNPPACSIENSWVLPKVASTYIAIVGKTDNAVMERVNTYMMALVDYWSANNINNFTLFYKDTVADLNEYLASDTYLYPDTGVCFGISVD